MLKSHSEEIQQLIQNAAAQGNILPITSRCDSHCIFCSHKNNPPEIDVISIGVRTMEEIAQTMGYLDPRQVITIGESASSIIEGEPFTHPHFTEILKTLRSRFPGTPIAITTNGYHLTASMVDLISSLGNISLSVSLNSCSIQGRNLLMGDSEQRAEQTLAGIRLMAERGIPYDSSVVAMPSVTGWDDVRNTIQFLSDHKTSVVRVFLPAISGRAKRNLVSNENTTHAELREFLHSLSTELACPVLIEPSLATSLTPEISGVIKNSPAWRLGLRRGDVIRSVNGRVPRCRVEAWQMLGPHGPMLVVALKDGQEKEFSWTNPYDGGAGITMEYDFDMGRADHLRQLILSQPGKSLLLASEYGHAVVQAVTQLFGLPDGRAEVIAVKNLTFGGSIKAAGLLTVDDYDAAFKDWLAQNQLQGKESPSQLLVPLESFNSLGFDLKHRHYMEFAGLTKIPVQLG
jgi:wyosine [tRNA(Phe)-imidazoG37] synthetase (radical SAM superfamily)